MHRDKLVLSGLEAAETARDCCDRYDQFTFEPLPLGTRLAYAHDRSLNTIVIDGARTFAKGFTLPAAGSNLVLEVDTDFYRTSQLPRSQTIMYPGVILLDAHYRPIPGDTNLYYEIEPGSVLKEERIIDRLPLTGDFASARFVLIYAKLSFINDSFQYCQSGTPVAVFWTGTGISALPGTPAACPEYPYGPEGNVGLRLAARP